MSGQGGSLRDRAKNLVRRSPRLRGWAERLTDATIRLALAPQIEVPAPAETHDAATLEAQTDALNQAAEVYFSAYPQQEFILGKPYSDALGFPQHLFNLGVLFHWLRLSPGDVVAELGAGTAWVSHFLNLYGCRTVAIDVSATALDLAQELFRRDARTRWNLEPRFVPYDGHRFPLEDASCDRMVIHDAFHHVPNQAEILREMARVLRPGGVVAMVEPGRRHSLTADSQKEMDETGVLENDIVVEELAALAARCGFTRTTVVPVNLAATIEIPAEGLEGFLKGRGFRQFWTHQARHLLVEHYILLYKGEYRPTTRRPGRLVAEIELPGLEPGPEGKDVPVLQADSGTPLGLRCRVTNRGDTLWLPESAGRPGCTYLGAHLYRGDDTKALDYDWYRAPLKDPVEPDDEVLLDLELPAIDAPGTYRVVFDLVAEDVLWFTQKGSPTRTVRLEIG